MREILAADATLAAYFDRITVVEKRQLRGPIVTPSLLIVPGALKQLREIGGDFDANYTVAVLGAFPSETQWIPDLSALAAPSAAATGAGTLTGAFRYRVTQASGLGESEAGTEATVTADADVVTVTRPALSAAATCWRVWASGADRTALRWAATLPASVSAWVDDGTRRDEIAPIPFAVEDWMDEVQKILIGNETLTWLGVRYATAAMGCEQSGDELVSIRNIRLRELVVTVPTLIDPLTKTIRTDRV
jgi:hypothetical protein